MASFMLTSYYKASDRDRWNTLVQSSKNGSFQFDRGYLEYHRDRFQDQSIVIDDAAKGLLAVLPAHTVGPDILASHHGLSFGGLVVSDKVRLPTVVHAFDDLLTFCQQQGYSRLLYKTVPHIYQKVPADEDRFCLFLSEARPIAVRILLVVDMMANVSYQDRRKRSVKKARRGGVTVRESHDWEEFWDLLTARLKQRYDATPVHSFPEIVELRDRFPQNIRLFVSQRNAHLLGGAVIYATNRVARAQYIAASEKGLSLGALDILFQTLLEDIFADRRYFCFGTSDRLDGRQLALGLVDQKEGFGARAVSYGEYEIDLARWRPGTLREAMV